MIFVQRSIIGVATAVFAISTIFSACSIYLFQRRYNLSLLSKIGLLFLFILLMNVECFLMALHPLAFTSRWLERMFRLSPLILLPAMFFCQYRSKLYACVTLLITIGILYASNLQIISILLYCFMLPFCLWFSITDNSLFFCNLFAYFSLFLPSTYFCYGWFWYAETAFIERISNSFETEQNIKLIIVSVILIVFTILAMRMISTDLLCIQITGATISKYFIEFILFLIFILVISTTIIITVYNQYPLSIDRHEWIVTQTGLSISDQAVVNNIQQLELNMAVCGRFNWAVENVTRLIYKYKMKLQYGRIGMKVDRLLEQLYLVRGLLSYRDRRFDDALNDFNQSLAYNPNNKQAALYVLSILNILGKDIEALELADTYSRKSQDTAEEQLFLIYQLTAFAKALKYWDPDIHDYTYEVKNTTTENKESMMPPLLPPPQYYLWPTHLQLVELSGVAYCINRLSLPWIMLDELDDTLDTGYYGVALRNTETEEIVIAHRGTYLDVNTASLFADYDLFRLQPPDQIHVAWKFTEKIRKTMDQQRILWHTGHSLGGAIAEFLVANETLFGVPNSLSFAVTFDSPGIMELLEDYYYNKTLKDIVLKSTEFRVISYLSSPNVVNTMGTHIGLVLRLLPLPPAFIVSHPVPQIIHTFTKRFTNVRLSEYKRIIDLFWRQIKEQGYWHSLQTITESIKWTSDQRGFPLAFKQVKQWPRGQQQLVRFLDLAYRKNLTSLDIFAFTASEYEKRLNRTRRKRFVYEDPDVVEFKRYSYHVISEISLRGVPFEFFNLPTQSFLKHLKTFLGGRIDPAQLKRECGLLKVIGVNDTEIIFNQLSLSEWPDRPDEKRVNIGVYVANTPHYQKINALTLYTMFSIINLDQCF